MLQLIYVLLHLVYKSYIPSIHITDCRSNITLHMPCKTHTFGQYVISDALYTVYMFAQSMIMKINAFYEERESHCI